jgi:hypothetical protein
MGNHVGSFDQCPNCIDSEMKVPEAAREVRVYTQDGITLECKDWQCEKTFFEKWNSPKPIIKGCCDGYAGPELLKDKEG